MNNSFSADRAAKHKGFGLTETSISAREVGIGLPRVSGNRVIASPAAASASAKKICPALDLGTKGARIPPRRAADIPPTPTPPRTCVIMYASHYCTTGQGTALHCMAPHIMSAEVQPMFLFELGTCLFERGG